MAQQRNSGTGAAIRCVAGSRAVRPRPNKLTPVPTGRPLKERWRWGVYAALVPAQVLGIVLWREPVLDPLTVSASILDKALLIASVCLVVCATLILVVVKQKAMFRAGQLAALAGGAMGISVLAAAVRPPRDLPMLSLPALGLVGAVGAGYWLWTRQPAGARITPSALLASTLAGAALPLLQLWSTTSFAVNAQNVSLGATSEVAIVASESDGALDHVQVATTFTNNSDVRARVIVTQTLVCWWESGVIPEYDPGDLRRRLEPNPDSNCATWRPLAALSWVDGGTDIADTRVIDIPADHPHVVLQVRVAYARGDRLAIEGGPDNIGSLGSCTKVERYLIREESRLRGVAQQEKYLLYSDDDDDGGLNFHLTSRNEMTCPNSQLGLQDYYAITTLRTIHESWLAVDAAESPTPTP